LELTAQNSYSMRKFHNLLIFNEYGDVFEEREGCCSGVSHKKYNYNINIKSTK
jgi:hypothetical protein